MARASRWRVYIDGAEELAEMFQEMQDVAKEILDEASKKGAEFVLEDAKRRVPVRTGKLKNSLDIKLEKSRKVTKKAYQVYSKGVSKSGIRYAFAVERGTSKTRPQPFLRPALDENVVEVKRIISEEIVKGLERVN